jgi:hypothetical protein
VAGLLCLAIQGEKLVNQANQDFLLVEIGQTEQVGDHFDLAGVDPVAHYRCRQRLLTGRERRQFAIFPGTGSGRFLSFFRRRPPSSERAMSTTLRASFSPSGNCST